MGNRVSRLLSACLFAVLASGCQHLQDVPSESRRDVGEVPSRRPRVCGSDEKAGLNVKLDMIRELMDKGKFYAALAYLDGIGSTSLQAVYLRAEALRQTDRSDQAESLYRRLFDTCMAGWGYYGVGLIAGRENDFLRSVGWLTRARAALPTDPRIRNDLGYALLRSGYFYMARIEFMTALELDGDPSLVTVNLAILLAAMNRQRDLRAFAGRMKLDAATMAHVYEQAAEIRAYLDRPEPPPVTISSESAMERADVPAGRATSPEPLPDSEPRADVELAEDATKKERLEAEVARLAIESAERAIRKAEKAIEEAGLMPVEGMRRDVEEGSTNADRP